MGLIGIFTSPFLHGSFTHLLFNCIPLFLLMNLLLLAGLDQFIVISLLIIVISGLCVWLVGRPALHVGASGLIMGYWGYLMINAILYPSIITVLLIIFCFLLFCRVICKSTSQRGNLLGRPYFWISFGASGELYESSRLFFFAYCRLRHENIISH
ncbi:MAG: rhomboid family intramembrane serine protease [Gammaproteobacteria bacterium]|nr:rhomboid family intramembrane serine protease [Gammaproteobacteria bacterium]